MKEFIVILAAVAVLLGLTAIRYRKQIAGMLQVYRMLRSARNQMRDAAGEPRIETSSKLVSCSKCGTWTPESAAIRMGPSTYYCSKNCLGQIVEAD